MCRVMDRESVKGKVPYSSKWEAFPSLASSLTPEQKLVVNGVCYEREKQLLASSRCAVLMEKEIAGKGKELGMIIAEQCKRERGE